MNPVLAISVLIAQGLVLGADEFVFHCSRGLPRWERIGHPFDTLSVLLCLAVVLVFPAQQPWTWIYFGLAIFSCLCVTKDEWVHVSLCKSYEQWLHALLFLLHPILLWAVYELWRNHQGHVFLLIETALATFFMFYQIFYWNFFRGETQGEKLGKN